MTSGDSAAADEHKLSRTWNPRTDMYYGTCSCGWKTEVSLWDAQSVSRVDAMLTKAHADHVAEVRT